MKLTILVLSCAKYADRRQACRETWAKNLPAGVTVAFIMGGSGAFDSNNECVNISFHSTPDTYPELPQKTRRAMEWAVSHPECQWVFKCDDDSVVHIPRLLDYIAANPRIDYCGFAMVHEWPVFASGGAGYLLSRKAAAVVAETMTIEHGAEDVSVARCLASAKINLTPCPRFHPWNHPVPTVDNDQITAHYMTPSLMRQVWGNLQGQKIPKIFHWIWVGGKPMPEKFVEFRKGWLAKHPSWDGLLWGEKNPIYPLTNQREYDAAKTLAQKADILRYEILHEYGGVYLDVDMECLRNIEPLLQGIEGFSGAESDKTVAIGIMGAVPKHPLFGELVERLPASFAEYENIVSSTGPEFMTRHCLGRKDFRIYPPHVFYPIYYNGKQFGPLEMAYTNHHWAHSWRSDSPTA